jgi:hypothetical protein
VLWGGFYLVLGPLRLAGDGDLYWQRWLGEQLLNTHRLPATLGAETFTAAGAAWVPQEWLFSVVVAMATNHHVFVLLSLLMSALPAVILISIYWRARNTATRNAIGFALLLCGFAFLESFGVRAQVLGWTALAAFMLFLERRDRWYYAAIPTAIVWANLHASVVIAPAIVLARAIGSLADGDWKDARGARDLIMLAAVVLAIFCTPLGWRLPAYAIELASSPIRHFIAEWQPPGVHDLSFMLGALPIALAIVLGGRATLLGEKARSFPAALMFAAMLLAGRNIALFAIVAAPLAAGGLDARFPAIRSAGRRFTELEPVALVSVVVAIAISVMALLRIQRAQPPALPVAAIASIAGSGAEHRIFCENFTWCSLVLQYPAQRVFLDGRCDPYPSNVWNSYVSVIRRGPYWQRQLQRYGVDPVVASRTTQFGALLASSPDWRLAFRDRAFAVYLRN